MTRLLDIILSGAALLLLSPLLIPLAIALRLTGEGEIFFVQQRIGRGGKPFGLYKFATMLKNLNANEAEGISAGIVADEIMEAVTDPRPAIDIEQPRFRLCHHVCALPLLGGRLRNRRRGLGVGSRRLDASMPHHIRVLGGGDG